MLSATDALFSLHTSSIVSAAAKNIAREGSSFAAVTGVCFVQNTPPDDAVVSSDEEDTDSDGDDDNLDPLQFKCSNLLLGHNDQKQHKDSPPSYYQQATHLSAASHTSLSGVVLASCHQDGTCKLWDLATRRCIVNDAAGGRDGPGLAIRRFDQMQQFVYQSRDVLGTVSLHDIHRPLDPILQLHTHSATFCQMAPCLSIKENPQNDAADNGAMIAGERNLIALPTNEQSVAIIRDLRCDPASNPTYRIDIGNEFYDSSAYHYSRRNYGMLTCLGLCQREKSQQLVLGCGMEDGSALFYDLRSKGSPWLFGHSAEENGCVSDDETSKFMCHTKLGKDPVLSLDLSSSCNKGTGTSSLVAVAGCAGDADELSELPEADQGTISTIKIKLANELTVDEGGTKPSASNKRSRMKASVRARTPTCSIESGGKIGVSVCRFRPDGRIFAVGGWDCRLRLFDRASSKPLAILHGHENTVVAVDWEGNAASTGLLATGAADGRICIYRVFPNTSLKR